MQSIGGTLQESGLFLWFLKMPLQVPYGGSPLERA